MAVQVSALHIYPIKSCRGISVESAELVQRGFAHDRRWMIVNAAGKFVTQRDIPRLALVRTSVTNSHIHLSAPDLNSLELPLEYETGERIDVEVWSHRGVAVRNAGGSAWISEYLGSEHNLVYMPSDHERAVNPARAKPGDITSFADAYPLLVISEASLEALNARLETKIEMRRFRPNVVVKGCQPFAEDTWQHFTIGKLSFRGVKRCDRCAVTTVDPETGERGREPLATLAKFRQEDGKVWFGMNVIHDAPGTLRVGDKISVR